MSFCGSTLTSDFRLPTVCDGQCVQGRLVKSWAAVRRRAAYLSTQLRHYQRGFRTRHGTITHCISQGIHTMFLQTLDPIISQISIGSITLLPYLLEVVLCTTCPWRLGERNTNRPYKISDPSKATIQRCILPSCPTESVLYRSLYPVVIGFTGATNLPDERLFNQR